MTKHKVTTALFLVAFVGLALPAAAGPEMIPTNPGNRWEYDVVKLLRARITYHGKTMASLDDPSSGSAVYEVVSVAQDADPPVYDYRESVKLRSVNGNSDSDTMQLDITNDGGNLHIMSTVRDSPDEKEPEKQTYDPPLLYFSMDAASGKSWEVGELRDGNTTSPTSARGAGRETITVPAGTFKDCLKVVYLSDNTSGTIQMWEKTFTVTSGRSRGVYWIAEGVGVVKELEVATSVAETPGPDGKPVTIEAASCVVSELKPGYLVKD